MSKAFVKENGHEDDAAVPEAPALAPVEPADRGTTPASQPAKKARKRAAPLRAAGKPNGRSAS